MNKSVIIIGAGIGGLAAALRLRHQGYEVKVFEQNNYVGGKLAEMHQDDHIVSESILDPRSLGAKTSSYHGSLYGASSNGKLAAFSRHANFSKQYKNLYFVGGSVHPGGGIPLCLNSAKIVVDFLDKQY